MSHRYVHSGPEVPPPGGAYSPAVLARDICFISGQLPLDPATGELEEGPIAAQAAIALENVLRVVRAAGLHDDDLTSLTVLLADIDDWAELDGVLAARLAPERRPSRAAYAVAALPKGARVEIQAIAVRSA